MTFSRHTLRANPGARKRVKRLGRGNASGHGTTATRGTKGQRARQGGRKGLIQLGVKHFVSHLPKTRGFVSQFVRPVAVSVVDLAGFAAGSTVDRASLVAKGLVKSSQRGSIKLIGTGKLPQLSVKLQAASAGARTAVEEAGGTFEAVPLTPAK